jgi:glycolate oxidase iron-sulfur subunit
MQTHFTEAQLADPLIREGDAILRTCVHCGFCTATCPTFVMTGDERDSPRGRIWMLREVLERPESASKDTSYHIDRCLGCLSCTSTCPSGVDYAHLLDIGREKLDSLVPRQATDKLMRRMLAAIIPHAATFQAMMRLANLGRPLSFILPQMMRAALQKLPRKMPGLDPVGSQTETFAVSSSAGKAPVKRVILLAGCAQRALDPEINASTIRVLNRLGVEVIVRKEAHCCGALAHHIGETKQADAAVRAAIYAWHEEITAGAIDAIIVNASGCGTMIKDYGHLMRHYAAMAPLAAAISAKAKDVSELIADLDLASIIQPHVTSACGPLAYHSACSLQHGQKIHDLPLALLRQAGFDVVQPVNGHLCCGSAGVYNILQPAMASALQQRKLTSLQNTGAVAVAAGNIGCITQLNSDALPVRHTIQFIDWASGGPRPI